MTGGDVQSVWIVMHHHEDEILYGGSSDKVIGYFSTEERARAAVAESRVLEGFRDYPDDFEVIRVPLGLLLPSPGIRIMY